MNGGAVMLLPSALLTPSEARNSHCQTKGRGHPFLYLTTTIQNTACGKKKEVKPGGGKCSIGFGDLPTYGALGTVESVGVVFTPLFTSFSTLICRRSDQRHHAELVQ